MIERFRALDSFSKSALFVVAVLWVSTHIGALAMWLAAGDPNTLMAWVILDVSFCRRGRIVRYRKEAVQVTYYEALEDELNEDRRYGLDSLDDYRYAVFYPRVNDEIPHRKSYDLIGVMSLAWCMDWIRDTELGSCRPGAFVIREQRINDWRDIDV